MFGTFVQTIFVLVKFVPIILYTNIFATFDSILDFQKSQLVFLPRSNGKSKKRNNNNTFIDFQNGVIVKIYKS